MPDDLTNKAPQDRLDINAAIQRRHPDSLLNWTERIIRMRKEVPEVGWGDFTVIPSHDPAVLVMRYDWRNNWVLFVHNLDAKPRDVTAGRCGRARTPAWVPRAESGRDCGIWWSLEGTLSGCLRSSGRLGRTLAMTFRIIPISTLCSGAWTTSTSCSHPPIRKA